MKVLISHLWVIPVSETTGLSLLPSTLHSSGLPPTRNALHKRCYQRAEPLGVFFQALVDVLEAVRPSNEVQRVVRRGAGES